MSLPGAMATASGLPRSVTSSSGQGLGLRTQNSRKSYACSRGRMTRLACAYPGARPEVCPPRVPSRHAARTSRPLAPGADSAARGPLPLAAAAGFTQQASSALPAAAAAATFIVANRPRPRLEPDTVASSASATATLLPAATRGGKPSRARILFTAAAGKSSGSHSDAASASRMASPSNATPSAARMSALRRMSACPLSCLDPQKPPNVAPPRTTRWHGTLPLLLPLPPLPPRTMRWHGTVGAKGLWCSAVPTACALRQSSSAATVPYVATRPAGSRHVTSYTAVRNGVSSAAASESCQSPLAALVRAAVAAILVGEELGRRGGKREEREGERGW